MAELKKLAGFGWSLMQKEGLDDEESVGSFWRIVETRPFMRIKKRYADMLIRFNKMWLAKQQYEELLQLNEEDNQGDRYGLMSVYCRLEELDKAEVLAGQFEYEQMSALFLLPLILLHLKRDNEKEAKRFYRKLQRGNPDCRRVFGQNELNLNKALSILEAPYYSPFGEDEIFMAVALNLNDFISTPTDYYYQWFKKNLKKQ